MTPYAKRRPGEGDVPFTELAAHDTSRVRHLVASTTCPLACPLACRYLCPIPLPEAVEQTVAELAMLQ